MALDENMNNKIETVTGRLLQFFGEWKVQSGYGTFPLAKELQSKPDVASNGAMVNAAVDRGIVTSYGFTSETIDTP